MPGGPAFTAHGIRGGSAVFRLFRGQGGAAWRGNGRSGVSLFPFTDFCRGFIGARSGGPVNGNGPFVRLFFGASGVCGAEYAEVCGTPAADGGIAVCFGFPGAFSAASGVRPGNVESASSRLTAVTAEWQTGHSTRLPTQAALTAKELPQIWQRQGTASCSSVSGLGFSSCLAVTEAVQMGHFTWRPRKDAFTAKRLPHDGHVQATVSWEWGRHGGEKVTGG